MYDIDKNKLLISFRKSMRLFLIEHKVVHWLIMFIKKELHEQEQSMANNNINNDKTTGVVQNCFNPYLMEYAWALLMNLCLHEES